VKFAQAVTDIASKLLFAPLNAAAIQDHYLAVGASLTWDCLCCQPQLTMPNCGCSIDLMIVKYSLCNSGCGKAGNKTQPQKLPEKSWGGTGRRTTRFDGETAGAGEDVRAIRKGGRTQGSAWRNLPE
jgi:hypothetical protein